MSIPYDYDQTNIDHLRAVIDEQEQTIKYLHERCKAEEVESAKLRELLDTGYPNSLRPELHKALKARGIDYWVAQGITFWNRDDGCECLAYGYQADGVPKLAIKVVGFTDPEQAIAATVGTGTLTAEQVSKATYAHSIHADCADADWQAIADELNDTLGRGTCEADETETIKCWVKCKDEPSTERMELIHVMECSECGHTYEHVNGDYEFCPRCGRRRVEL